MPSLTIKPPKPPSQRNSSSPPQQSSFTFSAPPPQNTFVQGAPGEAGSPVAPAYSPITPKVQPALPALTQVANGATIPADMFPQAAAPQQQIAPPMQYISPPPPQPFSSEDSTDAIALRAAISALQFQKKKAQEDVRALKDLKQQALDEPQRFRAELAAGKLREHRPEFGGAQAILNQADSDDEDEQVVLGAHDEDAMQQDTEMQAHDGMTASEVPDSQPSLPVTSATEDSAPPSKPADFSRIPGPQNIVRMPHINWEKYHLAGAALDQMHEQQRKWPGSSFAYGRDRGREFAVTAPYSPFHDVLDGQQGRAGPGHGRNDSVTTSAVATPTTVSEHPMETRRSSKNQ